MRIRDLKIELVPISALNPYAGNAHTHSKRQVRQIADSINIFGWTNPILADANNCVIAGHGRLGAAKLLGFDQVPVIRIEDLTEVQKRAYVIADNKLAENAGWDPQLLAMELQGLLEIDPGFEISVTGFEMGEIDLLLSDLNDNDDDADELPEIDPASPVTQPGDLWQVDQHRLLCGDATKSASFEKLMAREEADMVFTDPPYNVHVNGHVSGRGSHKHSEFVMASGEMSEVRYTRFLERPLELMAAHSRNGAIHFVCIDWRHIYVLLAAGRRVGNALLNICIWVKTNGGMGSLYRSQYELVVVFKTGSAPHINNVELGRFGRNRSNVWTYAGMNTVGAERDEALAMHPTVKPVAMVRDAILDCSNRGGIVLDAFIGSGTTLIAAHRVGRRAFGLEIEPRYVDVALRRFRSATGIEPVHVETGRTFGELEQTRALPSEGSAGGKV